MFFKFQFIERAVPVGVPGVRLADDAAALPTDPGHSLMSLDSATGGAPIAPLLTIRYQPCQATNTVGKTFAVPDKIFGLTRFLDFIDRGTHCACAASATGSAQARGTR